MRSRIATEGLAYHLTYRVLAAYLAELQLLTIDRVSHARYKRDKEQETYWLDPDDKTSAGTTH